MPTRQISEPISLPTFLTAVLQFSFQPTSNFQFEKPNFQRKFKYILFSLSGSEIAVILVFRFHWVFFFTSLLINFDLFYFPHFSIFHSCSARSEHYHAFVLAAIYRRSRYFFIKRQTTLFRTSADSPLRSTYSARCSSYFCFFYPRVAFHSCS